MPIWTAPNGAVLHISANLRNGAFFVLDPLTLVCYIFMK